MSFGSCQATLLSLQFPLVSAALNFSELPVIRFERIQWRWTVKNVLHSHLQICNVSLHCLIMVSIPIVIGSNALSVRPPQFNTQERSLMVPEIIPIGWSCQANY